LKQQDKIDSTSADIVRTEAIRSLCQGPAFLQRPLEIGVPEATLRAFELDDEELFVTLLRRSLDLMVEGPLKAAMLWALGSYSGHDTLTERRNDYLKNRDISYRTLVRHEQEGAARLAALMMKIKEREVADAPASPANLQYLQQRVNDLETLVSGLAGFSQKLLELLDKGEPLDPHAIRQGMSWSRRNVDELWGGIYAEAETRVVDRAFNLEMNIRDGQES
jgi:hypothetical protein